MERAVVAIGVNRTGGLPVLKAAASGAQAFAVWARDHQRIPDERITVLTDERGKVTRDAILDAVAAIADLGFVEQLLVYFSGHGINVGLGEQWLLSDAPKNSGAAVNVVGSEYAARFCGIGHVVFISDACRTAAPDIQTQRVTGGDIFPNLQPEGEERPVDQFFATLVGRPALEVRVGTSEAERYVAAYTTVLLEALRGNAPGIITGSDERRVIRPAALKRHMGVAVPDFLRKSIVGGTATQQPDARITSGEIDAWVAEFPLVVTPADTIDAAVPAGLSVGGRIRARRRRPSGDGLSGERALPPPFGDAEISVAGGLVGASRSGLLAALRSEGSGTKRGSRRQGSDGPAAGAAQDLFDRSLSMAARRDIMPDASGDCAVAIRGARIVDAVTREGTATAAVEANGRSVSVLLAEKRRAATVALRLDDRSMLLIPALRGFVSVLTVDDEGRLDDVAFEAREVQAGSDRHAADVTAARQLRDVVAASAALGVLRVDQDREASALADRLRTLRHVDPAMAVNAAYAFHERRMRDAIAGLAARVEKDQGVRLFDLAMLSRGLSGHPGSRPAPRAPRRLLCPFVPMRTMGWALLGAFGIEIEGGAAGLRGHLRPSVWTHFEAAAARTVVRLLREGAVD